MAPAVYLVGTIDVHRNALDPVAVQHLDAERAQGIADAACTTDGARRTVEDGEEPVAGRLDLVAAEATGLPADDVVVAVEQLDETVETLAAELAGKSPLVMRWGRDSFYRAQQMSPDDALRYLQAMLTVTTLSDDSAEGIAAFHEKRAPDWRGR